jgi:hypothetical protein
MATWQAYQYLATSPQSLSNIVISEEIYFIRRKLNNRVIFFIFFFHFCSCFEEKLFLLNVNPNVDAFGRVRSERLRKAITIGQHLPFHGKLL